MKNRSIFAAVTFSALAFASFAGADDKKPALLDGQVKAIGVEKIYDAVTLTPDQIRSCLASSKNLDEMSTDLHARAATFPAQLSKISALSGEIDATKIYLDKNPTKEVNDDAKMAERNGKVADYNKMIAEYNQVTEAYGKVTGKYTADNTTYVLERAYFKETCAGKHYYAEDMNAVTSSQ